MSDTKAEHIEAAAAAVVDALEMSHESLEAGAGPLAWDEVNDLVQNKVRIVLAEQYDQWEKQWIADLPAADPPKLGFRPIR